MRIAVDKIRRPVDGVNDPGLVICQPALGTRSHALLSYEESGGEPLSQPRYQQPLHLLVRLCHQVVVSALLARSQQKWSEARNYEKYEPTYQTFLSLAKADLIRSPHFITSWREKSNSSLGERRRNVTEIIKSTVRCGGTYLY